MFCRFLVTSIFCLVAVAYANAQGIDPQREKLEQGLKLVPHQADVVIDTPAADEVPQCQIRATDDKRGFIIAYPQGRVLRRFSDENGDNRVDLWAFFQDGVEVYREIDSTGSGKRDQFRWLNNAGTRWGIDTNGDRVIDLWKEISAEEVSREIALALSTNDVNRFLCVALSQSELQNLALGDEWNAAVAKKLASLKADFAKSVAAVALQNTAQWYQLSAVMPGKIPAQTWGNAHDLTVYENAVTTVGNGNATQQIAIGTLICLGENNWRVLDTPKPYDESTISYTFIRPAGTPAEMAEASTEVMSLVNQYQEIQAELPTLPVAQRAAKHKAVFECMIRLIVISPSQAERDNWTRMLAESILAATLQNEFPDGAAFIQTLYESVAKTGDKELAAFVRYRQTQVDYFTNLHSGSDDMKSYMTWLENLEQMATEFEGNEARAEAFMQLASFQEMNSRNSEDSLKWYNKVVETAADGLLKQRAQGAVMRLSAPGKEIPFKAIDTAGKPFDNAAYKGKFVLISFWDSDVAAEMQSAVATAEQRAGAAMVVVSVNCELDPRNSALLPGPQIQLANTNGIDGTLPVAWGIQKQNLPCMILYGKDGKVIRSNIGSAAELQATLAE